MNKSRFLSISSTLRLMLMAALVMVLTLGTGQMARAASTPAPVDLGMAAPFAILSKTGVTNVPISAVSGNIGTSPIDSTAITGFSLIADSTNVFSTSSQVTGKIYASDYADPTPTNLTTAVSNMEAAYADAAGRTLPDFTELYAGDLSGKTLVPGLYKWGTGVLINTSVTLAGPADAIWIFQIAGDLTLGSDTQVILSGGAQASNIFWQVAGGTGVEIGTTSHMEGTILASKAIHLRTGASLNGRALAQSAVTLEKNQVVIPGFNATNSNSTTTGVFRPTNGLIYLKKTNDTGFADATLNYGQNGDYPVMGDWNGDGTTTLGVYRNGIFYLRDSNTSGFAENTIPFGNPGDQPVAGDWDGNGTDTIGVYRNSNATFYLRNDNSTGPADLTIPLGNPGDIGIVGDWTGKGYDSTGVFRPSNGLIYLKNLNTDGFAETSFNYGLFGDQPVVGDWNGDGIDTIGVYRNNYFYLRNSNNAGFADLVFALGLPGDIAITGKWGLP